MKIAYVTDSGCGRSIAELAKEGIISVPLQIIDGNTTYQDLETITGDECLKLVSEGHVLKTSQPALGLIMECFESLKEQGTDVIIAVPICPGLSGTLSTMVSVAKELDMKIITVDTYVTSEIQYYLITRIKQMYEEGYDDMHIKLTVDEIVDSANTFLLPRNLDALVRGGRLTPFAAGFAKLLKIQPILTINKSTNGRIDSLSNVRTYRKAISKMIEIISEAKLDSSYTLYISHAGVYETACELKETLSSVFKNFPIEIINLVNPVSVHTGKDCIAIQYFKKI